MRSILRSNCSAFLLKTWIKKRSLCSLTVNDRATEPSKELQDLCRAVSSPIGGLDDLEKHLDRISVSLSSHLVTQVIDSCKNETSARRLLRFFSWSCKTSGFSLDDKDFNHVLRVLAEKKDHTGMQILLSDLRKENRVMDRQTFGLVAENLVKLGEEDEALGIFKNLDKFNCPQDSFSVAAIISALCARGHARKAMGVVHHHKDKIPGNEVCVYRSLLYGWSVQKNVKEARKVLQEIKSAGITPDLFCYNTLLSCLCERNVKRNPSGLVPEALNVMMEMRSYKVLPTSISYNILLSCLGRTRRVRESCRILEQMKKSGCDPDSTTYYLIAKVLYLTGRFGKGNKMVDEMIERGLKPECKLYNDLIGILCGVERVSLAIELFEKMKRSSVGAYGPVYDVLISKLCRGGDFEKGRELWDEAMSLGLTLNCSFDLLDPSITEVFRPAKKKEEVSIEDYGASKVKIRVKMNKIKPKWKSKMKKKRKSGR